MIEISTLISELLSKDKALEQMHNAIINGSKKKETFLDEAYLSSEKKSLYEMHKRIEDYDLEKYISTESKFSKEINKFIKSAQELDFYQKIGLEEQEINNRKCLVRNDIDLSIKDDFGRNNLERMNSGLAPLDGSGKPLELHHIGQERNSPLAELTQDEHRKNYSILHTKQESNIDRIEFDKIRSEHWKTRADILGGIYA